MYCAVKNVEYRVKFVEYQVKIVEYQVKIVKYRVKIVEYRVKIVEYRVARCLMNCSLTHMHNSTEGNLLLWKGAIMQCLGWNLSASI